ncbi:MAG: hypothetical protein JWM86_2735 [Thermoleophilia bacterium]|nr:hypothetical protein [Thermoleophilia bacterium]
MSTPPSQTPTPPSHDDLMAMHEAPDLSKSERSELQKAARFQRRVELWEARRATPHPPKLHRAIITLGMMAACLGLLWLLLGTPGA